MLRALGLAAAGLMIPWAFWVRWLDRSLADTAWHLRYGSWWALQWCADGWLSLGLHVDPRTRRHARTGLVYGPYLDLHLLIVIVSLGRRPQLSGELERSVSVSRGGL